MKLYLGAGVGRGMKGMRGIAGMKQVAGIAGVAWLGLGGCCGYGGKGGVAFAQVQMSRCNSVEIGSSAVDQFGTSFPVTGLSGIAALPLEAGGGADRYIAVMDNSNKLVYLTVVVDGAGCITQAMVTGGLRLADTRDFEGIAIEAGTGSVWLAEEGTPAIHRYSLADGSRQETLGAPGVYANRRANFGFESLTISDDGLTLWTCNEEALTVDGPVSTTSAGTWVRLQRYVRGNVLAGFVPAGQYGYRTDKIHGVAVSGARSGVSELLLLEDGSLLALERSFAFSSGGFFRSRFVDVNTGAATDVTSLATISAGGFVAAERRLLLTDSLNNMEGMCLGRSLGRGRHSVIGILDDGDPVTVNAVVGLAVQVASCLADYNQDGGVDGSDVDGFFADWVEGASGADANEDGGVDGSDVEAFFTLWVLGGC